MATKTEIRRSPVVAAMLYGTPIGLLGGLLGLGGSELRLLVLDGVFGYGSRRAVALNLAIRSWGVSHLRPHRHPCALSARLGDISHAPRSTAGPGGARSGVSSRNNGMHAGTGRSEGPSRPVCIRGHHSAGLVSG